MIPALLRGRTVLVVDDNDGVRHTLRELLVAMHADVLVAVNGVDGLAQLEHCQPDLIFCDLKMPALGGLEFAHRLRQDPRFRKTLLIAVTGSQPDTTKMWRAGFTGHIRKPFTRDALTRIARRLAEMPMEPRGTP
jgi:two-component system, response regulator